MSKKLLIAFHDTFISNPHLLSFAWETISDSKQLLVNSYEIAKKVIAETTILVVIGYSFPFYNRDIDNMIFETIRPSLKKIYFQDPFNDGSFLRKRYNFPEKDQFWEFQKTTTDLKIQSAVDIEHIDLTDQFHIPIEL